MLDRIDIQIEVSSLSYQEMSKNEEEESSESIRQRVNKARKIMQDRFKNDKRENGMPITCNAQMEAKHIRKYCQLSEECKAVMKGAFDTLGLSARGHDRILRLARTIADLSGCDSIEVQHLAEAIQLRGLDKKYFK